MQTVKFSAVDAEDDYLDSPEAKQMNQDSWLEKKKKTEVGF